MFEPVSGNSGCLQKIYIKNDAIRRPVTVVTGLTALATVALAVIGGLAYFHVIGGYLGGLSHITQLAMLGGGAVAAVALISFTTAQLYRKQPPAAMQPTAAITKTETTVDGTKRTTYTVSMENFDPKAFTSWLYKHNPHENKQAVFQHTLEVELKNFCEGLGEAEIVRTWIETEEVGFPSTLEREFSEEDKCTAQGEGMGKYYDYTHGGQVYVDFANANVFGGGWRGNGFVQEEILFVEFFELALLAYMVDLAGHKIHPTRKDPLSTYQEMVGDECDGTLKQTPFFVPAKRSYQVDGRLYGNRLQRTRQGRKPTKVEANDFVKKPSEEVYIAGIAARNWGQYPGNSQYTELDLVQHLQALYGVCLEARKKNVDNPEVHSGQWGCGVFGGNVLVMTTLHLLAGRMTGVHMHMYDMDDQFVQKVKAFVDLFETPAKAIAEIVELQEKDEHWTPALKNSKVDFKKNPQILSNLSQNVDVD
ncbi:MAG: hypothetical protein K940chlam9_01200 [Chlamydiae bacterium]|nr:hypothetical protein [Chlamydiota bacterium]